LLGISTSHSWLPGPLCSLLLAGRPNSRHLRNHNPTRGFVVLESRALQPPNPGQWPPPEPPPQPLRSSFHYRARLWARCENRRGRRPLSPRFPRCPCPPENPDNTRRASQRGNVGPKCLGCGIQLDGLSEISRQFVNCAVREFLSAILQSAPGSPNVQGEPRRAASAGRRWLDRIVGHSITRFVFRRPVPRTGRKRLPP